TPCSSAFVRASSTASGLVSLAQISSFGALTARATAIAPVPVPTSATRSGRASATSSARSTSFSVARRGVKTRPGAVTSSRSAKVDVMGSAPKLFRMTDWSGLAEREAERYREGDARVAESRDADARQRQLTRLGNAAYCAGLALLAAGEAESAAEWFDRAAGRYRESWPDAPPGSWGRPIGAIKARILGKDAEGAVREAEWAVAEGAAQAESPIGRYAATLALRVLRRDD